MFQTSILFKENIEAKEKIVVNQGGTSSGKTYSILQALFVLAMKESNQVITVVGQDVPNLKKGAYRDAKTIYNSSEDMAKWFRINETDKTFRCLNGSMIEFTSYKDEQDAKSGKRDYLFINEADGIIFGIYWQLAMRTRKKIFIDYNPSSRFWVHDQLIGKEYVKLIISDHRHNPFLSAEEHAKIESIDDPDLFDVYARGKTGKIKGLIYTKWDLVDEMPGTYKSRWFGLDFGFTNDPTALIDVRLSGGDLYLDEVVYESGMLNPDISTRYKDEIGDYYDIVADSAEPKSIAELKADRLRVEAAMKGPDSIKTGIDILKRYKLHITRRSTNLRKEIQTYKWKVDKNGVAQNAPVDFMNHALDAIRYVGLNKLGVRRERHRAKMKVGQL